MKKKINSVFDSPLSTSRRYEGHLECVPVSARGVPKHYALYVPIDAHIGWCVYLGGMVSARNQSLETSKKRLGVLCRTVELKGSEQYKCLDLLMFVRCSWDTLRSQIENLRVHVKFLGN